VIYPIEQRQAREALAAIPLFADSPALTVSALRGVQSLNNTSWIVAADGAREKFVLRLADAVIGNHLGIIRAEEAACARAAAAAGIAPELVHYDETTGHMVTRWIERGRVWEPSDYQNPANVTRLVDLLRSMHCVSGLPGASGVVFRRIRDLVATASELSLPAPAHLEQLLDRLEEIETECAQLAYRPPGLNHNDVWANNVIDDGTRLWLVDREFAGLGDGLYDLASTSMAVEYRQREDQRLLAAYGLGHEYLPALVAMKWVVRLFEAFWALIKHGLHGPKSSSGFDYLSHAQHMFGEVRQTA